MYCVFYQPIGSKEAACLPILTWSYSAPYLIASNGLLLSLDPSKRLKQQLPPPSLAFAPLPSPLAPLSHPFPIRHGVTLSLCLSRPAALRVYRAHPLSPSSGRNRRMTQTRVVSSLMPCRGGRRGQRAMSDPEDASFNFEFFFCHSPKQFRRSPS